jgi:hypothetical protein
MIRLLATGSKNTRKVVSAILFRSMPQTTLTKILRNTTYAEERRRQVVERKQAWNDATKRAAARKQIPAEDVRLIDEAYIIIFY